MKNSLIPKILIIRFSSFGDIVHTASVLPNLKEKFPLGEVYWVTRSDFQGLIEHFSGISKVIALKRSQGFLGLVKIALELRSFDFDYVYDAHKNFRSCVLKFFLFWGKKSSFATRTKNRWKRLLLFKFRINFFPRPFKARPSYLSPLKRWGVSQEVIDNPNLIAGSDLIWRRVLARELPGLDLNRPWVCLATSAAWPLKRWPVSYWREVIAKNKSIQFVLLGGPGEEFLDLKEIGHDRVFDLAGKLSLVESSALVKHAKLLISADTGLLHVADVLGVKAIGLIGPSAFGFTSSNQVVNLKASLPCQPCSKDGSGKCSRKIYQECMTLITPGQVQGLIEKNIFSSSPKVDG